MLDIGIQELLIIMVIALLVFGPTKLPELGRAVGRAMREFRRASDEFRSTVETNLSLNMEDESLLPPSAESTAGSEEPAAVGAVDAEGTTAEATPEPLDIPAPSDPVRAGSPTLEAGLAEGASDPPPEAGAPRIEPIEPFWAQRGGRLLHRSACGWAARIPDADRVVFKSVGEARELGLGSCPVCDPREGEPPS